MKDSYELALNDWLGTAQFDRLETEDYWSKKWAEAYVHFATFEKEAYLKSMGIKLTPMLGWAERGGSMSSGHGNSVPRFHITWGTGPGLINPFIDYVLKKEKEGQFKFLSRHQVTHIDIQNNQIKGISGNILEPSDVNRGEPSSREIIDTFAYDVDDLVISTGGIGANHDMIKKIGQSI